MSERLILTKFIEVPASINFQDKIALLNIWVSDMQRNGIAILSTSNIQRQENLDGTFVEGFIVEYRESEREDI
jgi:hypothetical protein